MSAIISHRTIKSVRKRDGSFENFDKTRIAAAIYKAAKSVQIFDRLLSDELAEVVELYLSRDLNLEIPDVEVVQDVVEKVLIETGNIAIAKAYILYRQDRSRARDALTVDEGKAVFVNLRGKKLVWQPEVIAARLTERTKLPRSFWEEILKIVEGLIIQ